MRGQAALEFITTYGWALLIILLMIGTISYFGVLQPGTLIPSRCTIGAELNCADYTIANDGTVSLQLKQGIGKTIYLQSIACRYQEQTAMGDLQGTPINNDAWSPRDPFILTCQLTNLQQLAGANQKVKVLFDIVYRKSDGGFDHTGSGEVVAEVTG